MTATEGYKGHRAGSDKGKVHKVFDEKGPEAAIKKAESLGKAESTARTWVSEWKNAKAKKADKASKKSAKASARKPVKAAKTSKGKKTAKKSAKPAVKRERIAAEASA